MLAFITCHFLCDMPQTSHSWNSYKILDRDNHHHSKKQILTDYIVHESEALQFIDKETTIICTLREDVHKNNHNILKATYMEKDIHAIELKTNTRDEPCLQNW